MNKITSNLRLVFDVIIICSLFVTNEVLADKKSCSALTKHNLIESIKELSPNTSQSLLLKAFCSKSKDLEQTTKQLNNLSLTKGEIKAAKILLCGRANKINKVKSAQRRLKKLTGKNFIAEHQQCINLSKKGVNVIVNSPSLEKGIVNIAVEFNKPGIELKEVTVEPEGALKCSGFGNDSIFDSQSLWGVCERNMEVPAPVSIIRVRLSRGLLNIRVTDPQVAAEPTPIQPVEFNYAPLPNIANCSVLSQADRILQCTDHLSMVLCYRELKAGNVLDCRIVLPERIYPNRPEVQIRYNQGEFEYQRQGGLGVTVYRNRPDEGFLAGSVQYSINFPTPVREQRASNVCDVSCPLFRNIEPCNRDCVFAEHVLEAESALGVLSLTREQGNSCQAPLVGDVQLSDIDKYRAYNLCHSQNAWGRFVTGTLHVQVSKYFYMNDFRTTHTVMRKRINGRFVIDEQWTATNPGERIRAIAALEIPFSIGCNN